MKEINEWREYFKKKDTFHYSEDDGGGSIT
jgi:hypothetical protein